jgi:hypothetical protein
LSHSASPFCFSYISGGVLRFCLGLASVWAPSMYTSY